MSNVDGLIQAKSYLLQPQDGAEASLVWPVIARDGPLALIKIGLMERKPSSQISSRLTHQGVEFLKKHLAHRVDLVLVAECFGAELISLANVWVTNQDESHEQFDLSWSITSPGPLPEILGLPEDFLSIEFATAQPPDALALTQRQREGIDAKERIEDLSALLFCLETLQGVISRRPNAIDVKVSEETAISLLAIHGSSAARALYGLDRFED